MDAHTLNAWTRFALQKGGIGSATALIDNPATDIEDLMFMAGEKIIVLRRLDDDGASAEGSKRKGDAADADTWFLGYCEGVVGRFKAAHVQFHGKLKKPILMRRSGVGTIRDSTLRPMSKSEAAQLHASQVPPGIPVTAVDSDEEPSTEGHAAASGKSTNGSSQRGSTAGVGGKDGMLKTTHTTPNPAVKALGGKLNRLGVTTPPLSDETHARAALQKRASLESDSDDSDTHLPWARNSSSSVKSSTSAMETIQTSNLSKMNPLSAFSGKLLEKNNSFRINTVSNLPPSPISSSESPLHAKNNDASFRSAPSHDANTVIPRIRAPKTHKPNQDSMDTMTTESSDDNMRENHTFSIYDIYGRDSVAFPNFNFSALNGSKTNSLGARVTPGKGTNMGATRSTPSSPKMNNVPMPIDARQVPASLRSPSQRRPMAAPPLSGSSSAVPNRRPTETGSTDMQNPEHPSYGAWDPKRRPSLGNLPGVRSLPSSQPPVPSGFEGVPKSSLASSETHSVDKPIGSNLLARRIREAEASADSGMSLSLDNPTRPFASHGPPSPAGSNSSVRPPFPVGSVPSPTGSIPARASSDRSSNRERIGSAQLRQNTSNPGSNANTNLGLPVANQRTGAPLSPSRSPSPLSGASVASGSGMLSASPNGPVGNLAMSSEGSRPPRMMASPVAYNKLDPSTLSFDRMGFVTGSCPPIPVPRDEPEEGERWRQILHENDAPGAKKSRKVKKMVHNGIPQASRATVWPFLLQSFLRRRAGLFEELCKVSQNNKGKKGKEELYNAIENDLDGAFPDHKLFMGNASPGRADLEAILKAYVHYNPIVGYTQGMHLVAGFLLIQMPAEDAFWMLCALMRDVHVEGYYAGDMKQLHVDGIVFGQLLQQMDPELAARLLELGVEPMHFAPNWILPVFARILPWPTLLRVWDVFFYEGASWILRVALAIIRIVRDPLMDRRVCPGQAEALRLLLHPPQHILTPENVLPCAFSVKIKDGEVRKLSRQASKIVRQSNIGHGRGRLQSVSGGGSASVARSASAPATKRQQQQQQQPA